MSLRARLLTVVVSLTAIGLIVASIVTYQQLRSFLVDRVDRQAQASAEAIKQSLEHGRPGPGGSTRSAAIASANPGLYVGGVANGNVQWAAIRNAARRDAAVTARSRQADRATAAAAAGGPFTVDAVEGDTRFRVQLEPIGTRTSSSSSPHR